MDTGGGRGGDGGGMYVKHRGSGGDSSNFLK